MGEFVVNLALETIGNLFVGEVNFLFGVSSQVKEVESELQLMQSFLEHIDRRKYEEQSIRSFVKQIRDLSYRIEDVIETHAAGVVVERQKQRQKHILNKFARTICESKTVHEVGSEITAIKTEISNLIARMNGYYGITTAMGRGESEGKNERKKWLRQTDGHGVEEHFVGMERDISSLLVVLLDDVRAHRVVSIWGMGGSGKSTLAKKIYHHKEIRRGFKRFAWVCVSQDCKPKIVLQDLLKKLTPTNKEEIMAMGDSELVEKVYEVLKGDKWLVVLDDIWEVDGWKCLCRAFPIAEGNSKFLITTRNESVAKVGVPHELGFLSEDEGWELLQKKAFTRRDPKDLNVEPGIMEHLGWEMVRKCGCLPLAISVLGGILSEKNSFDSWEIVNKDIDLFLTRGTDSEEEGGIKQVLSLSYDDLPYHLKPCFLYLSRFREDETIDAEQLYLLWIAEGIVSPKDQGKEETLMDVSKRYLGELARRSMVLVQVDGILAPEKFKSCRLHDLLRDLCMAKSVEEEFLYLKDFRGGNRPSLSHSSASLRRLAIYADKFDSVSFVGESTQQLRSLLLHMTGMSLTTLPPGMFDLKFLRVLCFENLTFEEKELSGLGGLVHLRLLSFRSCDSDGLPSCIADLPFLQILELSFWNAPRLRNVFSRIKRLRYLSLPYDFVTEENLSLCGLDELEVLLGFNDGFCEIADLSKLKSLRRLEAHIYKYDNLSKFIEWVEDNGKHVETKVSISHCNFGSEQGKSLLRKVFMSCIIHFSLRVDSHIGKLPEHEAGFFPNLISLYMGGAVSEDPMGTLEKLPKLRRLVLSNNSFVGELTCHAWGFPQLRFLYLGVLTNLKKWTVEEGAMPHLSHLMLLCCYNLEMIPEGIRFIATLQKLDIVGMLEEFENRVREGGEDFDKVCHVNSTVIRR